MASENGERVSFSPSQQSKVDELINLAYTKAYTKARTHYQAEIDTLKTRITELENKKLFSLWRRK